MTCSLIFSERVAPDVHRSFFATEQGNASKLPSLCWLETAVVFLRDLLRAWFGSRRWFSLHVESEDQVPVGTLGVLVDGAGVVGLLRVLLLAAAATLCDAGHNDMFSCRGGKGCAVTELTDSNWDMNLATPHFIMFYAPWCGHCKKLQPEWDSAAKTLKESAPEVRLAKVDATENRDTGSKFDVQGFPTIKWGSPDNLEKYEGGRDFDSLQEFAQGNLKPVCSPANIDLCDDDKKKEIEAFQAMSSDDLEAAIAHVEAENQAVKAIEADQGNKLRAVRDRDDAEAMGQGGEHNHGGHGGGNQTGQPKQREAGSLPPPWGWPLPEQLPPPAPPSAFRLDDEVFSLPHVTEQPARLYSHGFGFFGKAMAARNFKYMRDLKKSGQKSDRSEWFMTPQTVNAYYLPVWNEMVFPVAILQPPFFFKNFHPAMNFGSIGAIMGHEMTHGFDVSGRKFDKDGNEVDWWEPEALEEFLGRAQCVADFYSNYTEYGVHLNGEAECGENIADMGGVKFAFRGMQAYMKSAKAEGKTFPALPRGLTPEQLYFVSYGQTWCTKSDQEYLLMLNAQDEHSLPRERVNGQIGRAHV